MKHGQTLWQAVRYLFYSVATTLVNWLAYSGLMALFGGQTAGNGSVFWANTLAWVAAVTFSFFANKLRVFRSMDWRPRTAVTELLTFISTRLAVGAVEIVLVPLLVALGLDRPLFGVKGMLSKVIVTPILIGLNYLCGKLLVFRKKAGA